MEKTMMLYTSATGGEKTFSLMPIHADCPFVEAIYMPKLEALAILSKSTRDTFTMMERLDDFGNPQMDLVKTDDGKKSQQNKVQRIQVASPWEYFIHELDEIRSFVKANAVNSDDFNFNQYIKSESGIEVVSSL